MARETSLRNLKRRSDESADGHRDAKRYAKPELKKGPRLSDVTAQTSGSAK